MTLNPASTAQPEGQPTPRTPLQLIEILYDGDSFFFTQREGQRPVFNQCRCWSEYQVDQTEHTVSAIAAEIITATLDALGYAVTHTRHYATDVIDGGPDEPSVFSAQQDECAGYLTALLQVNDPETLFPPA